MQDHDPAIRRQQATREGLDQLYQDRCRSRTVWHSSLRTPQPT